MLPEAQLPVFPKDVIYLSIWSRRAVSWETAQQRRTAGGDGALRPKPVGSVSYPSPICNFAPVIGPSPAGSSEESLNLFT